MNEKIANLYEKNFNIKTIGLRFFTIYGPFGRPDMFIPKVLNKMKKINQLIFIIMEIILEILLM